MPAMIFVGAKAFATTRATEREAMVVAMRSLQETTWDQFIKDKGISSKPNEYRAWLLENHHKLESGTIAALGNDPQLVNEFGKEAVKYTQMKQHADQEMTKNNDGRMQSAMHSSCEGMPVLLRAIPQDHIPARGEIQWYMVRSAK